MSSKKFASILLVLTITSIMVIITASRLVGLSFHIILLSYSSIIFFSIFCVAFFIWGKKAAASNNLYNFNNVIVFSTLSKMILSLAFLLLFKKIFNPDSKFVVVPFLLFYTLYTIFETYFLTLLGKSKRS